MISHTSYCEQNAKGKQVFPFIFALGLPLLLPSGRKNESIFGEAKDSENRAKNQIYI
jgi:hypothetical protein